MTDEIALKLIEALNRHAAALEKMSGLNTLAAGLGAQHVYHHDAPQWPTPQQQPGYYRVR